VRLVDKIAGEAVVSRGGLKGIGGTLNPRFLNVERDGGREERGVCLGSSKEVSS